MGLRADAKYRGEITFCEWTESRNGTPGLQIDVESTEGSISHTWYLTEATLQYFERDMKGFGVTPDQLASGTFMQYELPTVLKGREVSFGTKEEVYNGKNRIKVSWIGAHKAPSDDRGVGYAVAQMFGGTGPKNGQTSSPPTSGGGDGVLPIGDDDIPF
jgi:hypothetical protein